MADRIAVNQPVNITAWYFHGRREFKSFPRRMEFDNQEYTFADGLRYLIGKGVGAVEFFDMTSGNQSFRLRLDEGQGGWTLVSIQSHG